MHVDTSESRAEAGQGMVEVGEYHWMIEEVEAQNNDFGTSLKVVASVQAGTTAQQVGRKQTEFFQCSGKAVDRLRRLLVATEMMTDQQWVERIGQPLEFDEKLLKGRQFCARIKLQPYQGSKEEHKGKSFPAMGFDIWSVFDDKAKHIPKDPDCMAMLIPPTNTASNGGAKQQTSQQKQQPATSAPASSSASPSPAATASTPSKFSW